MTQIPGERIHEELLYVQGLILSEIKGIDPCYAYQAAILMHNFYCPHSKVTSTVRVESIKEFLVGGETPIYKSPYEDAIADAALSTPTKKP